MFPCLHPHVSGVFLFWEIAATVSMISLDRFDWTLFCCVDVVGKQSCHQFEGFLLCQRSHSLHSALTCLSWDILLVVSVMKLTITGYRANIPFVASITRGFVVQLFWLGPKCLNYTFLQSTIKKAHRKKKKILSLTFRGGSLLNTINNNCLPWPLLTEPATTSPLHTPCHSAGPVAQITLNKSRRKSSIHRMRSHLQTQTHLFLLLSQRQMEK